MVPVCYVLSTCGAFWFSRTEPGGQDLWPYHAMGVYVQVPLWLSVFCNILFALTFLSAAMATAGLISFFLIRYQRASPNSPLLMIKTLNKREKRIIEMVSRPAWPKTMLCLIVAMAACGLLSLGVAVADCIRSYRMLSGNSTHPELTIVLVEASLATMVGGIALMSAILTWALRVYGLVIRKLGESHAAKSAN